jgi:hypothetical protein
VLKEHREHREHKGLLRSVIPVMGLPDLIVAHLVVISVQI